MIENDETDLVTDYDFGPQPIAESFWILVPFPLNKFQFC